MTRLLRAFQSWTSRVRLHEKPLAELEPVNAAPRPLVGFYAGLSEEQKKRVLAFKDNESFGEREFLR